MTDRFAIKLLSVILGLFAWSYVNLAIAPVSRRMVQTEILYRNTPQFVMILPEEPIATIELEGSRSDFILSGDSKVQASVDLYNVRPGNALVPVRVTPASGLSVTSVRPSQINVEVVPLASRKIGITAVTSGTVADGYKHSKPVLTPSEVTITGPQSLIDEAFEPYVLINLEDRVNSINEETEILLRATQPGVVIDPEYITARVSVMQGNPSITVPIDFNISKLALPEGLIIKNYKLKPEQIEISGPSRIINNMDKSKGMRVKKPDLSNVNQSTSIELEPIFENSNISIVDNKKVLLELELEHVKITRLYEDIALELITSDNQLVRSSVSSYSVKLQGLRKQLDKIEHNQLKVPMNVQLLSEGKHSVNLILPAGLPEEVDLVSITPETIEVDIVLSSVTKNTEAHETELDR